MATIYTSIPGMRDILPGQSEKWQYVQRTALECAAAFGVREIRVPTIEKTELFVCSLGEAADVVRNEMYTFDKGGESMTLRPEGTSGTLRAVLEHNLLTAGALPLKLCYTASCFRHDNPQAGRYREFVQFGVEFLGAHPPGGDAELIALAHDILARLGVVAGGLALHINSVGCPLCQPVYNSALRDYYAAHRGSICATCADRLELNPLLLLDCKEDSCRALAPGAPKTADYLCGECATHFDGLQTRLDAIGLEYTVSSSLVRGLDCYTKTVFEFIPTLEGAQLTVCGGGRYDQLVAEMGGPHTPAIGFGIGLDRLIMLMEAMGIRFPEEHCCDLYIGSIGEQASIKALQLATALRREGRHILCDTVGRGQAEQMRYAEQVGCAYYCILGTDELARGGVSVRRTVDGEGAEVGLSAEGFAAHLDGSANQQLAEYRGVGK